ncbi:hypothetical protein M409DRAFT_28513 [Zasmidium cellare ATCC 36951]|uniref:Uncharacterized protein n=1 Tax=Zasmidium cellare ATCC 36951 TaxID=1080233 RepID=A0A6A6C2H0_ZASCE|nr:uncharacterized protein M409DRAFT_28513 [Zasmidium cellare ATCC 36951]KAF2161185.1 hypothetical protein M409DRAFT_28513 [Zasmidium cellare ATCC 36951]
MALPQRLHVAPTGTRSTATFDKLFGARGEMEQVGNFVYWNVEDLLPIDTDQIAAETRNLTQLLNNARQNSLNQVTNLVERSKELAIPLDLDGPTIVTEIQEQLSKLSTNFSEAMLNYFKEKIDNLEEELRKPRVDPEVVTKLKQDLTAEQELMKTASKNHGLDVQEKDGKIGSLEDELKRLNQELAQGKSAAMNAEDDARQAKHDAEEEYFAKWDQKTKELNQIAQDWQQNATSRSETTKLQFKDLLNELKVKADFTEQELRNKVEEGENALAAAQSRISDLEPKKSALEKEVSQKASEIAKLKKSENDVQERLETSAANFRVMKEAYEDTKKNYQACAFQVHELETRIMPEAIKSAIDKTTDQAKQVQRSIQRELEAEKVKGEERKRAIKDLKQQLADKDTTMKEVQNDMNKLQRDLDQAEALKSQWGIEANQLDEQVARMLKETNKLREGEQQWRFIFNDEYVQGKQKGREIETLKQDVASWNNRAEALQMEVEEEERVQWFERELEKADALDIQAQIDIQRLNGEVKAAGEEKDRLLGEHSILQGEYDKLVEQKESLKGEMEVVVGEKEALKGEKEKLEGEKETLEGDLQTLQGQKSSLEDEKGSLKGEMEVVVGEKEALEGELQALQGQKSSLEDERGKLQTALHESMQDYATVDESFNTLMDRVESMDLGNLVG